MPCFTLRADQNWAIFVTFRHFLGKKAGLADTRFTVGRRKWLSWRHPGEKVKKAGKSGSRKTFRNRLVESTLKDTRFTVGQFLELGRPESPESEKAGQKVLEFTREK